MLLVIAAGFITAACFYAYFVQYYTEHFYEGTKINGIDCSDLTEEQAAGLLQEELDKWELKVAEREGVTETISADQISMTYDNDGALKDIYVFQQPLLWFLRIYESKDYEAPSAFTYDEEALRSCFDNFQQVKEFVPMKNAEIVQNEDGTFRIDPEVTGTEMDQQKAYEAVKAAVQTLKPELDLEEFYLSPEVFADDEKLVDEVDTKNVLFSLTSASIMVQFGMEQVTIDENMLKDWLVKDKKEKYKIDETKIREFVQGLYDKYNVGHEGQLFKTKNGRVLTLSNFETPGWNIDVDRSVERYLKAIKEGYQGVLGPAMTRTDEQGNETPETYVEISLDEQTMWLIVDGEVRVETPIVSGGADEPNAAKLPVEALISEFNTRSTSSNGIWLIKKKQSPHFMKGPMLASGAYEYTLEVTYWLPFNDQVGIHDNYQRVDYGGKIYQTSGSHGCINTPFEAVEEIYQTVDVGTMVVVYGMDKGEDVFAANNQQTEEAPSDEAAEQTGADPSAAAAEQTAADPSAAAVPLPGAVPADTKNEQPSEAAEALPEVPAE